MTDDAIRLLAPPITGLRFRHYRGEAGLPGVITTTVPAEENERHGRPRVYVSGVSVRRPWRRRGPARALLASSLVGAREAGFTSASLGVDTDSATGATDLYRSVGFQPERTFIAWRKAL